MLAGILVGILGWAAGGGVPTVCSEGETLLWATVWGSGAMGRYPLNPLTKQGSLQQRQARETWRREGGQGPGGSV